MVTKFQRHHTTNNNQPCGLLKRRTWLPDAFSCGHDGGAQLLSFWFVIGYRVGRYEEYCSAKGLSFVGGNFGIIHQKTGVKDKAPIEKTKVDQNVGQLLIKKIKVKGLKPLTFSHVIKDKYLFCL